MNNLTWYVYRYDINKNKIYKYDIFDHYKFQCDVLTTLKTSKDKEEFSNELNRDVMYYFWAKSEHEIVITSFPPYISRKETDRIKNENFNHKTYISLDCGTKIDIYEQLKMNWDVFVNYIWNKKEQTQTTKMLPCPFCNKELMTIVNDENNLTCAVVCDFTKGGCGGSGGYRNTIEQAIEAWNRRAEDGR